MGLSLLTNLASLSAQRNVTNTQAMLEASVERLSSGQRINHASDDAAGLAISSTLTAEIGGLSQAGRNAQDAISMIQTAEAGLGSINGLLTRMRILAVESANGGTLTASNRESVNTEYQALLTEINRIVNVTTYNGQTLIDGSLSSGSSFQVGVFNTTNDVIAINLAGAGTGAASLNVSSSAVNTASGAQDALSQLDHAISALAADRAGIGAAQLRLTTTVDNLSEEYINLSAANSRILDVDVAEETASLTRTQILLQAGISVLAQANQQPAAALSLLGRS
jgi:flagellin